MTERFGLFIIIVLGESITSLLTDLPWRGELLNWEVYVGAAAGSSLCYHFRFLGLLISYVRFGDCFLLEVDIL